MALKILQMVKIFVESGQLLCSLRAIDQGAIIQRKEAEKGAEKGAEGEINLKEGLEAHYREARLLICVYPSQKLNNKQGFWHLNN